MDYEIIDGVFITIREYMRVMSYFSDWCFWNKVDDESATTEDLDRFVWQLIGLIDLESYIIRACLKKYYNYFDKGYLVR